MSFAAQSSASGGGRCRVVSADGGEKAIEGSIKCQTEFTDEGVFEDERNMDA
jgi:hypothetical protein